MRGASQSAWQSSTKDATTRRGPATRGATKGRSEHGRALGAHAANELRALSIGFH